MKGAPEGAPKTPKRPASVGNLLGRNEGRSRRSAEEWIESAGNLEPLWPQ